MARYLASLLSGLTPAPCPHTALVVWQLRASLGFARLMPELSSLAHWFCSGQIAAWFWRPGLWLYFLLSTCSNSAPPFVSTAMGRPRAQAPGALFPAMASP